MAFIPLHKMPLSPKADPLNAVGGSITAADYNRVEEEVRAIEESLFGVHSFVATSAALPGQVSPESATDADEDALLNTGVSDNVFGLIARLVAKTNLLTDKGILANSGYAQSGQRIIFPEAAHATFLSTIPSALDKSILVASTTGFPNSGILSILNDVKLPTTTGTMVEWIKYTAKTQTQFLNCERGFLGTTVGPHAGDFDPPSTSSTTTKNVRDHCVTLPNSSTSCSRRYPGWRYLKTYFWPALGMFGSLIDVVKQFRISAGRISVTAAALGADQFDAMKTLADAQGVLVTRIDGSVYLESQDLAYAALLQLRWEEALPIFLGLLEDGFIQLVKSENDLIVPSLAIPVFEGRMGTQLYLAALTVREPGTLGNFSLAQTADARVYATSVAPPTAVEGPSVETNSTPSTLKIIDRMVPEFVWTGTPKNAGLAGSVHGMATGKTGTAPGILSPTVTTTEYLELFKVSNNVTLTKITIPLARYPFSIFPQSTANVRIGINKMAASPLPNPSSQYEFSIDIPISSLTETFAFGPSIPTSTCLHEITCSVPLQIGLYAVTVTMPDIVSTSEAVIVPFKSKVNGLDQAQELNNDTDAKGSFIKYNSFFVNGNVFVETSVEGAWQQVSGGSLTQARDNVPTDPTTAIMSVKLEFDASPYPDTVVTTTTQPPSAAASGALFQGVVGYETFFISSPRTIQEKDRG